MKQVNPLRIYCELVNAGFFSREPQRRTFIEAVIRELHEVINEGLSYVLVAPPGIGKTAVPITYSIAALLGYGKVLRVVHALPLKSLADDIKRRFEDGISRLGIKCEAPVAVQYGLRHESPYFMAPYVASTIDMYVINLLKVPTEELHKLRDSDEYELYGHYEVSRSSILSSLNVLDEVHLILEGERGWLTIMAVLKYLLEVKVPFILMTATLPTAVINAVRKHLRNVVIREYRPSKGDGFYDAEIRKKFMKLSEGVVRIGSSEALLDLIDDAAGYGKLAVVVNTVRRATRIYEELRRTKKAVLIHSRFTLKDREEKVKELGRRDLVVSTQVMEAGIDRSFDVLISELAPMSSIVQRFGRLARHEATEGYWLIFYDDNTLKDTVYKRELLEASLKVLRGVSNVNWHLPVVPEGGAKGYKDLLDEAWAEAGIDANSGFDISCLRILRDPFVSSRDVVKYLLTVGSLIRDGSYLPIYVGDPPHDYSRFLESAKDSLIPSNIDFTHDYLMKAARCGYDVGLATLSKGGEISVRGIRGVDRQKLLEWAVSGYVIAAVVPRELYEGGVDGSGLKML